jgi:hypothetical protein
MVVSAGVPRSRGYVGLPFTRLNAYRASNVSLILLPEQALNQRLQLVGRERRDPYQARIEALQLRFAHRFEVDAMNALVSARPLQPAQENLGGTRVRDCACS